MSKRNAEESLGSQILAGLSEFCRTLNQGEPIGKQFTVRRVSLADAERLARKFGGQWAGEAGGPPRDA